MHSIGNRPYIGGNAGQVKHPATASRPQGIFLHGFKGLKFIG